MSEPQIDLEESLEWLRTNDGGTVIIEFLNQERENAIAEQGEALEPFEVGKSAGRIAALTFVLDLLRGD